MNKRSTATKIFSIPVIGYLLRTAYTIVRLPKIYDDLSQNDSRTERKADETKSAIQEFEKGNEELKSQIESIQIIQDDVRQHLSTLEAIESKSTKRQSKGSAEEGNLFANDHLLDKFYTAFEDKFRGSEEEIIDRQKYYLSYFKKSSIDFSKKPVLDIGSGRGEFIELLSKNSTNAVGLDINHDMVARAKEKDLQAIQGDALAHLRSTKSRHYGAITGFHIVEHIPFNVLLRIFTEAHRTLDLNGFVIFETPNPENLRVGSTTFYLDPSHLHPVPPALLAFTLEFCGFRNVEILRLHPDERAKKSGLPPAATELLFGPRDYAVVGYK